MSEDNGRTFSQEEVDDIIKRRLAQARESYERQMGGPLDEILSRANKAQELERELTELRAQIESKDLDEMQRLQAEHQREAQKLLEERKKYETAFERERAQRLDMHREREFSRLLADAKVGAQQMPDAIASLQGAGLLDVDTGDDGSLSLRSTDGRDPAEVVQAFVSNKPWFLAARQGGAGADGTGRPAEANPTEKFDSLPLSAQFEAGLKGQG